MAYPDALDNLPANHTDFTGTPASAPDTAKITAGTVNAIETALNNVEATLGLTPQGGSATVAARLAAIDTAIGGRLTAASNLSDVASAATARTNLGLGTAATQASGAFDAAGAATAAQAAAVASSVQKAANLSDVANAATARTNLGLGTAAVANTGTTTGTVPTLGASGTLAVARLATGTPDGTKYVRDDGTLATPITGVSQAANVGAFPATGSAGILYIDAATGDLYRWNGSAYVLVLTGTYEPLGGASNARPMRWLGKKTATIRNGGTARVKWLYFGDSYAQKVKQGIESVLTPAMGGRVGAAHLGALGLEITSNSTSGTVTGNAADFTVWPTGATTTLGSAGASQTYGVGGVSFTCDQIKVIHANKGGGFKIQVDGVDNTTPTVTSDNSVTVTTISVTRAAHTVTVVQTSGTPTIVGVVMEDTASSGIMYLSAGQGGISLSPPTTQAWTNWTTVLASVQPDVLTFEMKEGASSLAADLDKFLTATQAGCNCDVVLIQSPPVNTTDADQVAQNFIIRQKAAQYGVLTWDSYTPFKNYATLTALGMNGDGTHVTAECDIVRGALMMRDLAVLDEALYLGRNVIAAQVYASDRLGLGGPAGANGSLRLINTDIAFDLGRAIQFRDATGATSFASFDSRNVTSNPSAVPRFCQVGPTMAGLVGVDADRIAVRKTAGGNLNSAGWVELGGVIYNRASQTLAANGAVTFTSTLAECHRVALQANATSSSLSGPYNDGQRLVIQWVQDATGGRTYSWPGTCRFAGGTAPSDTTASTVTSVSFIYDGTFGRWIEVARAVAVPTT